MRILHYSLGFPPYRSGGLTKFCMDLMQQQYKNGNDVALLWPGLMSGKRAHIKKRLEISGIKSYELINPLPVPYDEGIADIDSFIFKGKKEIFLQFLREVKPDVVHIHTVMGLYSSFIEAAKELCIRTVFTTHDFFPICPKVTMYRHGKICDSVVTCEECAVCNTTALSLNKIKVLQSGIYRALKESFIVKKLRKQHRDEYLNEEFQENINTMRTKEDYIRLRSYYGEMIKGIDVIHYNSSVTQAVYEKIFGIRDGKRIPITHSAIADHRKVKVFSREQLRIRYLGPQGGGKGFFLLKAALDMLWKERQDFCLDIHFAPVEPSPYIKVHQRYSYDELEAIFEETDILVAPSIWYETFGYTVLEALSYGVPVIISGTVGAKDILSEGTGIIIDNISSDKLVDVFRCLTVNKLRSMNKSIIEHQKIMTLQDMTDRIVEECYLGG